VADWAVTGIRPGTLTALPYIGWFSQRHRLALKFGWWEMALHIGDYRCGISAEDMVRGVGDTGNGVYGGPWTVRSWCAVMPGEKQAGPARAMKRRRGRTVGATSVWSCGRHVLWRGSRSPFDAVTARLAPASVPSKLQAEIRDRRLLISNAPAGLSAQLTFTQAIRGTTKTAGETIRSDGARTSRTSTCSLK